MVDARLHPADIVAHDEEDVGFLLSLLLLGLRLLGLLLRPLLLLRCGGCRRHNGKRASRPIENFRAVLMVESSMDDCGTAGSGASYARAYKAAHSSDRLNPRHEENGQPHVKLSFYCSFQTLRTSITQMLRVDIQCDASL